MTRTAFTLVELLVVITIIVILLALLIPAMDSAISQAEKTACLVNQRNQVSALHAYGMDFKRVFPPWAVNGQGSAYDWRNYVTYVPACMGLLPAGGYLPPTQLGKTVHCPTLDSSGAADGLKFLGMDRVSQQGIVGGSYWTDPLYLSRRLITSYNYRGPSHQSTGKGLLKLSNASSNTVVTVDQPDLRWGATFQHIDGYNRAFGDGHGGWYPDPNRRLDSYIRTYGHPDGYFEGGEFYQKMCEKVYGFFALPDAGQASLDPP